MNTPGVERARDMLRAYHGAHSAGPWSEPLDDLVELGVARHGPDAARQTMVTAWLIASERQGLPLDSPGICSTEAVGDAVELTSRTYVRELEQVRNALRRVLALLESEVPARNLAPELLVEWHDLAAGR